jgi:hypothetical protein
MLVNFFRNFQYAKTLVTLLITPISTKYQYQYFLPSTELWFALA